MSLQNVFTKHSFVMLLAASVLAGCGQADSTNSADGEATAGGANEKAAEPGDPHDIPLTDADRELLRQENEKYAEAIAHIQSYRDTIRDETIGGTPAKAHRSLDNLDYVLQVLPEIAQKSGVPKSKWEEVNTTAQNLRELFDKVHANIDAGKEPDYQSVADEIDKAVAVIAAIESE